MSLPLIFHPEVEGEVASACTWYEHRRSGLGEEFLDEVRESFDQIRKNPESFALADRDTRAARVGRFPYVIYYQVKSDQISVLAIQHGSRHPWRWRARLGD